MDTNSQNLKKATIMMVDDEPITMFVVQTYLEEFGYQNFVQVEDSTTAIKVIEDALPDILLLDLMMPGISGFDILKILRNSQKFKYLPIIVLTSSTDSENKLKALELGATDFLAKPVDQSELGLRVRNTLAAKAYMDQLAFYDPLTQLPNKFMFNDRFSWSLNKAKRYHDRLALLNVTIDNFSRLNATIGVGTADDILVEVANRLKNMVREGDSVTCTADEAGMGFSIFRIEGSIFSVLLDRIFSAESAALVARRILETIREPIQVGEDEVFVTASIGIATYPDEAEDVSTLRTLATSAKDFTVNKGGDAFNFSSPEINALYQNRQKREMSLRQALKRKEFLFHYQPKVDVRTGKIKGVEALLRWQPQDEPLVSPVEFIPLLEETGLIVPVGTYVLGKAVSTHKMWINSGYPQISMAINLSVKQLDSHEFFTVVEKIIEQTDVSRHLITLEITESLLLEDIESKILLLKQFRKLGLKISIDDFGTGYSSLGYLAKLPLDELKIDRSFIVDIEENKESQAIVSSIIFLAKSLGLSTVAEGIETEGQLKFLQQAGCDVYQGFYFSKPVAEADLLKLLTGEQH
jgi:diguanylate cyclase (GGDEF)-like protein